MYEINFNFLFKNASTWTRFFILQNKLQVDKILIILFPLVQFMFHPFSCEYRRLCIGLASFTFYAELYVLVLASRLQKG